MSHKAEKRELSSYSIHSNSYHDANSLGSEGRRQPHPRPRAPKPQPQPAAFLTTTPTHKSILKQQLQNGQSITKPTFQLEKRIDPLIFESQALDQLNIFDSFTINTNFTDTRYEEIPNSLVVPQLPNNFIKICGQTQGWTRADLMVLQVPVVLTWAAQTYTGSSVNYTDPQYIWPKERLTSAAQAEFALLNVINSIIIRLGENELPIGCNEECIQEGLRMNMADCKFDNDSAYWMGQWGLPMSCLTALPFNTPTNPTGTPFQAPSVASADGFISTPTARCETNFKRAWTNLITSISALCPTSPSTPSPSLRTLTNSGGIIGTYNNCPAAIFNLALPLKWINRFFRSKHFLPPNTKITIEINAVNDQLSSTNTNQLATILTNDAYPIQWFSVTGDSTSLSSAMNPYLPYTLILPSGINTINIFQLFGGVQPANLKLIYFSNTLVPTLNKQVSEKWKQLPLLYNFESMEKYDIYLQNDSQPNKITQNIAVYQAQPLTLLFKIIDTQTIGGSSTPTPGNAPVYLANNTITLKDAITTRSAPASIAGSIAGTQRARILQVEIEYEHSSIKYRNDMYDYQFTGPIIPNAYDMMINTINRECFNNYGQTSSEQLLMPGMIENSAAGEYGGNFIVPIAAGFTMSTKEINSSAGMVVLRVIVTFAANNLINNKILRIWKKTPSQIIMQDNRTMTRLNYPSVKSNNGFVTQANN